jgi:spermidine/putrescine transport system substrate-binding protein
MNEKQKNIVISGFGLGSKSFFYNVFNKFLIISFYLFLFAFFLYLPVFKNVFFAADNVLNVYTFTDMISPQTAQEFEKKTGIRVNLKYYDTNEELYAKFLVGGGKGYDLITPTDYIVDNLIKNNLLHKIDKSKLSNYGLLDVRLKNKYFDLQNDFSIPYFWSTDGIIYDTQEFKDSDISWDIVFKEPINSNFKICMLDNLRESIFLGFIYLFNKSNNISDKELLAVKNLLIKQKNWVEVYLYSSLQYYLLSDVVNLAVTTSAFARNILSVSDRFQFKIPDKGSLIMIDNLAIPKESKKIEIVYKFIDFLLSKKVMGYNSNLYGYNPSNLDSYEFMPSNILNNKAFFPDDEMFEKLHLIHNNLDIRKLEDLWLEVKIS